MPITIEDLRELRKKIPLKHKFGAIRCEGYGIKFPSKLEKTCFEVLLKLQVEKKILFFLRQVGFDLPGSVRHFVDYLVFTESNCIFIEAKGRDLSVGKLKREQVEQIYNINIYVVKNHSEIDRIVKQNG